MTVETAVYISDLNANNPGATDLKSEGDDHMRLIKSVLKSTFPNITGAVTATQATLNATYLPLSGGTVTGDLAVNGNTTLGDASGDTVTVNASTASAPNGLTFSGGPIKTTGTISGTAGSTNFASGIGSGGFPLAAWTYNSAATDNKIWDAYADSTKFHLRVVNDAYGSAADVLTATRSGISVSQLDFPVASLTYNSIEVGFRGAPQNLQASNYTLVATDRGKHVMVNSPATQVTIPNGVFSTGDVVMIVNNTGGNLTIVQGSGFSLRQSGTSNTGNRTSLVNGVSQLIVVAPGFGNIHGAGLT